MTQEEIKEMLAEKHEADKAFANYLGLDYEDYCELNCKMIHEDIDFDDWSR